MSNPVGSISNQNPPAQNPANPAVPVATPGVMPATQPDFKSQVPTTVQNAAPSDGDAPISPRIVVDPLAGPITEFLTTSGTIAAQIPSAAVVAYLRAGLTSAGFAKPTADPVPAPTEANATNDDTKKGSVVA
jgi:hypothetical protein